MDIKAEDLTETHQTVLETITRPDPKPLDLPIKLELDVDTCGWPRRKSSLELLEISRFPKVS